MLVPLFVAVRHDARGVGVEDRGDSSGDGPAHGCAVGDPRDLGVSPDPPGAAVSGQPDRRFGIETWPGQRYRARLLSSHATSVDPPAPAGPATAPRPAAPRHPPGPPA